MKNKKSKIVAFVLAFTILLATVVVTSVANAKTTDIQITTDKEAISAGESATISVKVTTNYPVATMSIPVFYDKTLVDINEATATLIGYSVAEATTDIQSVDTAKVYANTDIDANKFGFVLATYIGEANATVAETINSVVLTFKVTAKADVSGNAVVKVVEESAKTSENAKGMLYFGATKSGTKITEVPENVENKELENATVNIKIGEDKNTLTLKENAPFEAVIDKTNTLDGAVKGTLYGFDTLGCSDQSAEWFAEGTIIDFFTSAFGDDYVEIIEADGGQTTGTIINILDNDGNVVETYTYIYFGDVDADGWVGASDAYICEANETFGDSIGFQDSLAYYMAGDIDGDAYAGASDAYYLESVEVFGTPLQPQSDIGAMAQGCTYEIM